MARKKYNGELLIVQVYYEQQNCCQTLGHFVSVGLGAPAHIFSCDKQLKMKVTKPFCVRKKSDRANLAKNNDER